jgi:hypothetical protein
MNSKGSTIAAVIFLLVIVNVPPINFLLGYDDCRYSNLDGTFTFEEMNSNNRNYAMAKYKFGEFKKSTTNDTILYRLCPINPLLVWKYGEYIFSEKYHLPYKNWSEVEGIRGPLKSQSGFQDF